ncbi:MAG: amidohydrolase family protein [Cellvibrionaceae bacterium]
MNLKKIATLCSLLSLSLTGTLSSAVADDLLIRNATVYTAEGVKTDTDLLVKRGVIEAIGKNLSAATETPEYDAKGQSVTPGLFNADTHLGVEEVSAVDQTVDYFSENERITASMKVADGFNTDSMVIPHNRLHGLTHALVVPDSDAGLFAGQAALIRLNANGEKIINDSVAVVVSLGEHGQHLAGGSRAVAMAMLREALNDAKDYAANRAAVNSGSRRDYHLSLGDLNSLVPVVQGKKHMIVEVNRADDILRVIQLAKAYKLKVILSGVAEGWRVADDIASASIPVILDPINNLPLAYEQLGARLDNAALMERAGVTMMFTGMGWQNTHNAYLVRQSAGNAVANGLSKTAAINAMTVNPAKVFSLSKTGRLAVGQKASLVVWSGDPLEVTSVARMVLIDGESQPLMSRSLRLRDRYYDRLRASME